MINENLKCSNENLDYFHDKNIKKQKIFPKTYSHIFLLSHLERFFV